MFKWNFASTVMLESAFVKENNFQCVGVHRKKSATGKRWNRADYNMIDKDWNQLRNGHMNSGARWSSQIRLSHDENSLIVKVAKKSITPINWSRGRSLETYIYNCSRIDYENIRVEDIGVMGLASHDLFTWNKETLENDENGRLDLSTIFDSNNGASWETGGNKKNSENAPVYTVTMSLVKAFKAKLAEFKGDEYKARRVVVKIFIDKVKSSYRRLTGLNFPTRGLNQDVTNTEQATMRALHDILPGRIKSFDRFARDYITLTYLWNAKLTLSKKELEQEVSYYDGDYDPEYLSIKVPFKIINLKEIDSRFISEFSPYNQSEMLNELKRVGSGELKIQDVSFIYHMDELFSKAICSIGNKWLPEVICR